MKKFIVFVLLLGAGAYATYYLQNKNVAKAPENSFVVKETAKKADEKTQSAQVEQKIQTQNNVQPPTSQTKPVQGVFSDGTEMDGPEIQVVEISYDGFTYTPNSLNLKVNDYVMFKNKSNDKFWPASNPHPMHDDYSAFDPKKPIDSGKSWKFQFTQVGAWKFHDHLNPSARGVVNVSEK